MLEEEKPIIATNHGGQTDIVIENENGFLIEYGDIDAASVYLNELLEKRELRSRIGRINREKIRHFSSEIIATEYLQVLGNVKQ